MFEWIRKHRWSCLVMIIVFIICVGIGYLIMIYPNYAIGNMDNVELGKSLDQYIRCDNCDHIDYQIIDEHGEIIDNLNANSTYQCRITFISDWINLTVDKPVRYIDTTPPMVTQLSKSVELEWKQPFDPLQYLQIRDNSNDETKFDYEQSYDNTVVDQLQTVEMNVCDQSNNCTNVSIDVIQYAPHCGDNAMFDGMDCVCQIGYEGDPWTGCSMIPKQQSTPSSEYSWKDIPSDSTNQPVQLDEEPPISDSSPSNPSQNEGVDGWSTPQWGYSIDTDGTETLNQGVDACVAAGESDQGKPENATGYACLTQGNGYTLTWFDANGNTVATIDGF